MNRTATIPTDISAPRPPFFFAGGGAGGGAAGPQPLPSQYRFPLPDGSGYQPGAGCRSGYNVAVARACRDELLAPRIGPVDEAARRMEWVPRWPM